MPVNAAGWRIEPPVSVAVAPRHRSAATAAAEPPDEPPGVRSAAPPRARQLAQHHRPVPPQVGGNGGLVCGLEAPQDVRGGGGLHTLGAEQVLDPQRRAVQRSGVAGRPTGVGGAGHLQGALRSLDHIGVERPRAFDRVQVGPGDLLGRERPVRQSVQGGPEGEPGQGGVLRHLFHHLRHHEEALLRPGRV